MIKEITSPITPLGTTNARGRQKKFGIKIDDRRRHVYVIGKTGVGKTTLLENMAIADIQSGKGVAIIDPHGEYGTLGQKNTNAEDVQRLGWYRIEPKSYEINEYGDPTVTNG